MNQPLSAMHTLRKQVTNLHHETFFYKEQSFAYFLLDLDMNKDP